MLGLPGSAVKAAAVVVPASDTAAPGLPQAAESSPAAATASSPKPSAAPAAKQVQGLRRNWGGGGPLSDPGGIQLDSTEIDGG